MNAAASKLLRRSLREMQGKTVWEAVPEELGAVFAAEYHRVAADGVAVGFEAVSPLLDVRLVCRAWPVAGGVMLHLRDVTSEKRKEETLRRSESHFRSLVESASDVIMVLTASGAARYLSPSFGRTLGHDARALAGRSLFELVHPDDAPAIMGQLAERLVGGGDADAVEWRMRHRDGSWRVFEGSMTGVGAEPGASGVVVIARDVTDRKRAEAAYGRLRAILEATPDIVAIADPHGRLLHLNRAGREALGVEAPASDLSLPDLHPSWAAELVMHEGIPAAVRSGAWSGETALLSGAGEEVPVSQVIVAHRDAAGRVEFLSTVLRDISDRKEAEAALRRSEARLRSLVENISDMVLVLDADGTVRYATPSVERLLGHSPASVVGTNALDWLHEEDRLAAMGGLERVQVEPGVTVSIECRCRHAGGGWRTIEVSGRNLADDPAVGGIVLSCRDLTDRRQLEDRLLQAQKMEAVGRLAGGVAHDFNNVLTAIGGHAYLVLSGLPADSELRGDLDEIRRGTERATSLTRQLLAFSRKQVLQPVVLDLNVVIEQTASMLRRLIGTDIHLTCELDPGLSTVRADPGQVGQVLMNLAVNARDAMPDGGRLTLATSEVELGAGAPGALAPGRYVLLTVSDTGTGIDESVRAHLFEPFFTTKEKGKGTGLGLATVYGIVHQSGGTIDVVSEPGQGAAFRVYLPAVGGAPDALRSGPADAESAAEGTETVLLVEDEPSVRSLARRILKRYGYRVLEAVDSADAVRIAREHEGPIPLVVTDVIMPDMNGPELVRQLMPLRPEIRVLYMSGYTQDAIAKRGVLDPGTAFLEKPFSPQSLARKVREVLSVPAR